MNRLACIESDILKGIKACVDARLSFGGTSPKEVRRQIEVGTKWLNELPDFQ